MSKTIKQIADELGVSKQKVYRYIKTHHISETHQENGVMHYDEAAEAIIKQGFLHDIPHHETHHEVHQNHINDTVSEAVIELLKQELSAKNKQISELQEALEKERQHSREQADQMARLADQAQKLQLAQLAESKERLAADETAMTTEEPKRRLFAWFRKGD